VQSASKQASNQPTNKRLTGPKFVESTITNQRYLQQLQNDFNLIIQGAGHGDTTFFQQDSARPHTANVVFNILRYVFSNSVVLNRFPERFACGWS